MKRLLWRLVGTVVELFEGDLTDADSFLYTYPLSALDGVPEDGEWHEVEYRRGFVTTSVEVCKSEPGVTHFRNLTKSVPWGESPSGEPPKRRTK